MTFPSQKADRIRTVSSQSLPLARPQSWRSAFPSICYKLASMAEKRHALFQDWLDSTLLTRYMKQPFKDPKSSQH